jgi:hypothetical protein
MNQTNNNDPWLFKNNVGYLADNHFSFQNIAALVYMPYLEVQSISVKKQRHYLSWLSWLISLVIILTFIFFKGYKNMLLSFMSLVFVVFFIVFFLYYPIYQYHINVQKQDGSLMKVRVSKAFVHQYIQLIKFIQSVIKSDSKLASQIILKLD